MILRPFSIPCFQILQPPIPERRRVSEENREVVLARPFPADGSLRRGRAQRRQRLPRRLRRPPHDLQPRSDVIKLFLSLIFEFLECLSLASLSNLV